MYHVRSIAGLGRTPGGGFAFANQFEQRLSSLEEVGIRLPKPTEREARTRARFTREVSRSLRRRREEQAAAGGPCGCYVDALSNASATAIGDAARGELLRACGPDPAAFATQLEAAGISLDACKPWYLRRTTLIAAGVIGAAGLALAVLR